MEDITKPRKKQAKNDPIVVGKRYKYKELCEIFGENEYGGNQKAAQINSWCLRYDIIHERGSQYYLINEIYERALKKEELRGRKNEYAEDIGKILLLLCYNEDDKSDDLYYKFTANRSQLYVLFGLCKNTFLEKSYNKNPELISDFAEHPRLLTQFQAEVFGKCASILQSVRSSLQSRCIVNSHESIELAYAGEGEDGRDWQWVEASVEEENNLLDSKRWALQELGCYAEPEVYRTKKEDAFRQLVLKNMREKFGKDICAYRRSITFWSRKDLVNDFIERSFGKEAMEIIDVAKLKKKIFDDAAGINNERFLAWIDKRTSDDWYTLNNGYVSKFKEEHDKSTRGEWKKWDDILIELYQGDEEEARLHRLFSNPNDEKDFYFGGEKHNEYMALREIMKSKYIELGPPPSQSGSKK